MEEVIPMAVMPTLPSPTIVQGGDLHDLGLQSLRASILFEPTDRISNLTVIDYHENDAATSASVLVFGVPFPGQGGTNLATLLSASR